MRHIWRQDPLVAPRRYWYNLLVPGSPVSSGGRMSKRKKTDIVSLKLRIREVLRKRLEVAAKAEERSLNSEMVPALRTRSIELGIVNCSKYCWRLVTV